MEKPSIAQVAQLLASEHAKDDPNMKEIYWAEHPSEVRLVEVTASVGDKDEVLPFRFTKDEPDVPYQSVVALLSPKDWARRTDLVWPDEFVHPNDLKRIYGD